MARSDPDNAQNLFDWLPFHLDVFTLVPSHLPPLAELT